MTDIALENGLSPQDQLLDALRGWHDAAGRPSLRVIARSAGLVSHTTVGDVLNGVRVPTWTRLASIVTCLGGDLEEAKRLWLLAEDASVRDLQEAPAVRLNRGLAARDAEAEAIRVASAALARLDQDARRRVLRYLQTRFANEASR